MSLSSSPELNFDVTIRTAVLLLLPRRTCRALFFTDFHLVCGPQTQPDQARRMNSGTPKGPINLPCGDVIMMHHKFSVAGAPASSSNPPSTIDD